MNPEVVIVDYGVGNLLSVQRGLEQCGARTKLSSDPQEILAATRVVLPGVGAFGNAMTALHESGLAESLRSVAARGVPLLGICLGMQLLLDESDEFGLSQGLGIIPGRVVAIPGRTTIGEPQKIPHIGWNQLVAAGDANWEGTVLEDLAPGDATYFVHSFQAVPTERAHRLADCIYGGHAISAVIRKDHVTGCQFHPEKSGKAGLKILARFCAD